MTKVTRARVGFLAGVLMLAVGVFLVFDLGWALIVGGVALSASFLLLYPVDEEAGR